MRAVARQRRKDRDVGRRPPTEKRHTNSRVTGDGTRRIVDATHGWNAENGKPLCNQGT